MELVERRKFKRYYPDKNNMPEVHFMINGSIKIAITIINISKGGLMGYTSSIEEFIGLEDQHLDLIEINFPEKAPFRCSGRILRLQPSISENKCFCAIEFNNNASKDNLELTESPGFIENDKNIPGWKFLERIRKLKNYARIEDVEEEMEARREAYNSFDDIIKYLTVEEKWYFFEILDEMKRHEPDYPEGLKQAFLRFCQTGAKQNNRKLKEMCFNGYKV